ncbi:unnamed protein product [Lymnaea stagnalis]|uniref:C1q domain-containing protein n=1 Tax=Lymnaea stagnalis TaxID=6523 RepID=A0AAV2IDR3_LYMST
MASNAQQTQRFIKFINQQLEVLKEEQRTIKNAVDDGIIQAQSRIDAWVSAGHINQTTFEEISNMLQQSITCFIAKSVEISGLHNNEKMVEQNETSFSNVHDSTSLTVSKNEDTEKSDMALKRKEDVIVAKDKSSEEKEANISKIMTIKFAILEEAVFSLKKTTEQVKEKQDNIDRTLKDVSTQQENVNKKFESSHKTNLNFKKQTQRTITEIEKKSKNISINVDHLFETVNKFDDKLNRLEEQKMSRDVSMNELNKQFSSVKKCSDDACASTQDLSKSVESTKQEYNEISNKMNQLEISINQMSSQYKEQFENMCSLNEDKVNDLIGMSCHLLNKRLSPLEDLREALNKVNSTRHALYIKVDDLTGQVLDLSGAVKELKSKCCRPIVGFQAHRNLVPSEGSKEILENFDNVKPNSGNNFNPVSGVFTAPFGGLYLISISGKLAGNSEILVLRFTKSEPILCSLFGNQTITRCFVLEVGDRIALYLKHNEEKTTTCVDFTCFFIN